MKTQKPTIVFALFLVLALATIGCGDGGGNDDGDQGYVLGATGPGGGKIFYISEEGFTVYQDAADTIGTTCYYLEAAPANMAVRLTWASSGFTSVDITGTETEIGAGKKNTAIILAADTYAPAALTCRIYNCGGKNDWFLPSKDELKQLYDNKSYVGNNLPDDYYYWSSSQYNEYMPWDQSFSIRFEPGRQGHDGKTFAYLVRAVRAF